MRCIPSKALCGFTSAEAAFGRRLKTQEESLMAPKTNSGFKNIDDFITQLKENLSLIQSIVLEGRKRYLAEMQDQYNKNATSADFEINSYVMVKREYFKIADHQKLYTRWTGPKQVIKRNMTYNTYLLKDTNSGKVDTQWTHSCKLKQYHMRKENTTEGQNNKLLNANGKSLPDTTVKLVNSDSDLLNPTISDNATPSVGNEIRATPNDGTTTNKHSATPGNHAPSNDENKTNGNFSGASVQSGDSFRLSEASSDENENRATPNDGEGKTGNYTGASAQSGDLFRCSDRLRNKRRINFADLADVGHKKPEPKLPKTISGILKHKHQSDTTPRFASFRVAGRPINGRAQTTKIRIERFIRSRKRRGGYLDFLVELSKPFRNKTHVWVTEFFFQPRLDGIRIQFDLDDPPYS